MFSNIIIRADASLNMGTGHIMRCLAFAQYLQKHQINPIFICAELPENLQIRLISENIEFILINAELGSNQDAQITINLAKIYIVNWVIIDGYQFDFKYQKQLKEAGFKILCFDDYGHCNYYYADLILNQNFGANQELYNHRESYTKLLLGSDYTLLRKEFLGWQKWQREIKPHASKILVTMGGSDPDNVTLKVIQALSLIFDSPDDPPQLPLLRGESKTGKCLIRGELEVVVIVGGSNPHFESLKNYCDTLPLNITLKQNVDDMPELMAWADMAICAGGSTNWELAFMGLPSIVIMIADNQREIAQNLAQMGLIISLGWWENVSIDMINNAILGLIQDQNKREDMSCLGRQLIDGKGCDRIFQAML
ncbi:UDP-2,4-diacetamido-2,4,6-trideoxy-beta-L-altropyranose hydrolase [Geminocystis sp. CENA526]|uniref:UDP-2,4-diacetamido-2,4, 6-trideoxy-beta-L-altropyranose hydrolase n=1 Tax=Geminocystis sp. CENA526 TaxID=1355871 RepID=UPI003D6FD53E